VNGLTRHITRAGVPRHDVIIPRIIKAIYRSVETGKAYRFNLNLPKYETASRFY